MQRIGRRSIDHESFHSDLKGSFDTMMKPRPLDFRPQLDTHSLYIMVDVMMS